MEYSDETLIRAFEACALEEFHHADHVRVAWIYLRRAGPGAAGTRMADGLRRFAASKGAAQKYHETLTRAWMHLVAAAWSADPRLPFDRFVSAHPALLDPATPALYYSRDRLASEAARTGWIEPDLRPLPPCRSDSSRRSIA